MNENVGRIVDGVEHERPFAPWSIGIILNVSVVQAYIARPACSPGVAAGRTRAEGSGVRPSARDEIRNLF
jgi:hypothetical protein